MASLVSIWYIAEQTFIHVYPLEVLYRDDHQVSLPDILNCRATTTKVDWSERFPILSSISSVEFPFQISMYVYMRLTGSPSVITPINLTTCLCLNWPRLAAS